MAEEFITRVKSGRFVHYSPLPDPVEFTLAPNGMSKDYVRLTSQEYMGQAWTFGPGSEKPREHIRRIRPQEAASLDELDAQISTLQAERKVLLTETWNKGHSIPLAEMKRLAAE